MQIKLSLPTRNNIIIMKFDRDGITEIVLKNCHNQIIKKYFDLTIRDNKQSRPHFCIHYLKKMLNNYSEFISGLILIFYYQKQL